MKAILNLEATLVTLLSAVTPNVYSNLPEMVKYPLIHLEQINHHIWIYKPLGLKAEVKICIYSDAQSNKECLQLGHEVSNQLKNLNYHFEIAESVILKVKNGLWCNEIILRVWIISDDESNCDPSSNPIEQLPNHKDLFSSCAIYS